MWICNRCKKGERDKIMEYLTTDLRLSNKQLMDKKKSLIEEMFIYHAFIKRKSNIHNVIVYFIWITFYQQYSDIAA